jgi:hypothetical protein
MVRAFGTLGNDNYKVMILGQLMEGDDVRTADFFEFINNHVQVKDSIFWIVENLRVLVANFVAVNIPQCEHVCQ